MNPAREAAIREAFASGEFAKGQRLWSQFAADLRVAIEEGLATPAAMADAARLLEWARLVVRCFRAHGQARLDGARVAAAYAGPPGPVSSIGTSL